MCPLQYAHTDYSSFSDIMMDSVQDSYTINNGTTTTKQTVNNNVHVNNMELVPQVAGGKQLALYNNSTNLANNTAAHLANSDLHNPYIIEMLKNFASFKEKEFKWEQSMQKLANIPNSDPNKSQLLEIINYVDNQESSAKEKAIYLYDRLGSKCHQYNNYIGAAKAFERAASLRCDHCDTDDSLTDNGKIRQEIARSTIHFLESAILNYDFIHKYKHAGTLHYRCLQILKKMNASDEDLQRHVEKALEYFTRLDEVKQRKRIDGQKISCYSSYNYWEKDTESKGVTTTTIKFHHSKRYHETDDSDSNHSTPPPSNLGTPSSSENMQLDFSNIKHNPYSNSDDLFNNFINNLPNGDEDFKDCQITEPKTPTTPPSLGMLDKSKLSTYRRHHHREHYEHHETVSKELTKTAHHRHQSSTFTYSQRPKQSKSMSNSLMMNGYQSGRDSVNSMNSKNSIRRVEDRIESARKLVKKLHKMCPFYEVCTNGDDAGRVYCKICDRYLGSVSSTLKNHVNTQEHRQAHEDSQQEQQPTTVPTYPLPGSQPIPPPTGLLSASTINAYPLMSGGNIRQPEMPLSKPVQYSQYQTSMVTSKTKSVFGDEIGRWPETRTAQFDSANPNDMATTYLYNPMADGQTNNQTIHSYNNVGTSTPIIETNKSNLMQSYQNGCGNNGTTSSQLPVMAYQ